ncbi:MlaD family protein, partial [Nocardia sp.]|uniref:MlaD family protein n=1 Tax=Nocardia sp. TaxID=1821 RepID=UPI00258F25FB
MNKIRSAARGFGGAVALAVTAALVTSCSSDGIYSIPLPGGADVGDHPMTIEIQFDDVLDLVPQSSVKVEGVPVGRVEEISIGKDKWTASVRTLVNSSVDLPANARAEVRQSNLLGEKFIELSEPAADPDPNRLTNGSVIPVDHTRHATEIEQVLQVEHNRRGSLLSDIRGNGFDVDVVGVPARRCDNLTRPRVGPVRVPLEAHAELVRNRCKNLLRTGTLRLGERDVRLSPGLRFSPHAHGASWR